MNHPGATTVIGKEKKTKGLNPFHMDPTEKGEFPARLPLPTNKKEEGEEKTDC